MSDSDNSDGSIDALASTIQKVFKGRWAVVSASAQLVLAEVRYALAHTGLVLVVVLLAIGSLVILWLLLLAILAALLIQTGMGVLPVLTVLLALHLLICGVLALLVWRSLKVISLRETRQLLQASVSVDDEHSLEKDRKQT